MDHSSKYLNECDYHGMIMVITCSIDGYFQDKDVPVKLIEYHPDSNTFSGQPIDRDIFEKIGLVSIPNLPVGESLDPNNREFIHESSWGECDSEVELVDIASLAESNRASSVHKLISASAVTPATTLPSVLSFIPTQGWRTEVARSLAYSTVLGLVDETVSALSAKHGRDHNHGSLDIRKFPSLQNLSQVLVQNVVSSVIESISYADHVQKMHKVALHESNSSLEKQQALEPIDSGIAQAAVIKSMAVEIIGDIVESSLFSSINLRSKNLRELSKSSVPKDEDTKDEGTVDYDNHFESNASQYSWDAYIKMVEAERDDEVSLSDNILDISRKNNRLLHLIEIGLKLANITAERVEKFDVLPKVHEYKTEQKASSPMIRKGSSRKQINRNRDVRKCYSIL